VNIILRMFGCTVSTKSYRNLNAQSKNFVVYALKPNAGDKANNDL